MKYVEVARPEYVVEIEPHTFGIICHIRMLTKWSPRVKAMCLDELARMHKAYGDLHAFVTGHNPKLRKFLHLLGFEFHQVRLDDDGVPHSFYRRRPGGKLLQVQDRGHQDQEPV